MISIVALGCAASSVLERHMADDDAIILRAAADGCSIRDIAFERGRSQEAVIAILDREAATWFDGKHLRRELLLEVTRLNALARKYYSRAMTGEGSEGINAGVLYTKLAERKAVLLGLNSPAAASIQLIHSTVPARQETTTEEIGRLIDEIRGVTPRERQLLDRRELDGDGRPEVLAEINELRAARGKPPYGEPEPAKD